MALADARLNAIPLEFEQVEGKASSTESTKYTEVDRKRDAIRPGLISVISVENFSLWRPHGQAGKLLCIHHETL